MSRTVPIERPFTGGVVLDQPAYKLTLQNTVLAEDLVAPDGIATQRSGWDYHGYTGSVISAAQRSVTRNKFLLADRTATHKGFVGGLIYEHPLDGINIRVRQPAAGQGVLYSPRCMYGDQLVWCADDGLGPIVLTSGAAEIDLTGVAGAAATLTAGESTLTKTGGGANWGASVPRANYAYVDSLLRLYTRITQVNAARDVLTLEGVRSLTTSAAVLSGIAHYGYTFPCVAIDEEGTATVAGSQYTGYGTRWADHANYVSEQNLTSIMVRNPDTGAVNMSTVYGSWAVPTNTLISTTGTPAAVATKSPVTIMARAPFKVAASHKGVLCGAGVKQYPNRVYWGSRGWVPGLPPLGPSSVPPVAIDTLALTGGATSQDDFLLEYLDIPACFDGDDIKAILPSADPLLALKSIDAYGLYGEPPGFQRSMLPNGAGAGCIFTDSAVAVSRGQFWAGHNDLHGFNGTSVEGLTEGVINSLWRSMTADFDGGVNDYIAIGEHDDHLFVSFMTNGGTAHRCMVYDLSARIWISTNFTNHKARWFHSVRVPGEPRQLIWVGESEGGIDSYVHDSTGVISGSTSAKDADGHEPAMKAYTSEDLDATSEIVGESKVLSVEVMSNIVDAGTPGDTAMEVSLVSGGALRRPATSTKVLGTINSDTVDRVDRKKFHPINKKGRLHQLRFEVTALGTDSVATKVQVPEISVTLEDLRSGT